MPLSDVARAALAAFLAEKRGRHTLRATVQRSLVEYFAGRDQSATELPVHDEADESWKEEWTAYATEAGVGPADRTVLLLWLAATRASAARGTVVSRLMSLLDERGVNVPEAVAAEAEGMLAESEQGDVEAQSTGVDCVFLLYLGKLPGEDAVQWWNQQRARFAPSSKGGTVNIKRCPEYSALHKKTTVRTLERALRSDGEWTLYKAETIRLLQAHQLPLAATRFVDILSEAEQLFPSDSLQQRKYFTYYFFTEHVGMGMPEMVGQKSALVILSRATDKAITDMMLQPTISTVYDMAQVQGLRSELEKQGSMATSGHAVYPATSSAAAAAGPMMMGPLTQPGAYPGLMPAAVAGPQAPALGLADLAAQHALQQLLSGQLPVSALSGLLQQASIAQAGSPPSAVGSITPSMSASTLSSPLGSQAQCRLCQGAHATDDCPKLAQFKRDHTTRENERRRAARERDAERRKLSENDEANKG